jgi:hypothetical protein
MMTIGLVESLGFVVGIDIFEASCPLVEAGLSKPSKDCGERPRSSGPK